MAITISDPKRNVLGDLRSYSGTFTTASGDSSLTITHGMYDVRQADVRLDAGGVNTPNPKITNSSGVCTFLVDDTLGYSGTFYFLGK